MVAAATEKGAEGVKGVILAGGTGSRLMPLTKVTNKHLLPVYDKPMIFYPLQTLKDAGIKDILVVTGVHHASAVSTLLGSGKEYGVRFSYKLQKKAGGLPQAIGLAEEFVGRDKFVSINGDNLLFESIKPFVRKFAKGTEQARILLARTSREEAKKAGVAVFKRGKIVDLVEKPKDPPTNWVSIGVYMSGPEVFDIIRCLRPSKRGELEITDVNRTYLTRGTLKYDKLRKGWMDAGTIDELWRANNVMRDLAHTARKP